MLAVLSYAVLWQIKGAIYFAWACPNACNLLGLFVVCLSRTACLNTIALTRKANKMSYNTRKWTQNISGFGINQSVPLMLWDCSETIKDLETFENFVLDVPDRSPYIKQTNKQGADCTKIVRCKPSNALCLQSVDGHGHCNVLNIISCFFNQIHNFP